MDTLASFAGTRWRGKNELWLDPLGNEAITSECTLSVEADELSYEWEYEGRKQQGQLTLTEDGANFVDSFHSETTMACRSLTGARGLLQVEGTYGPDGGWGWRIALYYRAPLSQMVLQMTNIAPWGEETRAVRATLDKS